MKDSHKPGSNDSQCYFVQLQIDSYLDGDMNDAQRNDFMSHVQGCEACGREFRFAQTVQDTVMDLPLLDCKEDVLEPVHRLGREETGESSEAGFNLMDWFGGLPVFLRYAMPSVLIAAIAVIAVMPMLTPDDQPAPPQVAAQLEPEFDPEEVMQAIQDLNIAIDYLSEVSERTEAMVGSRFLMKPLRDSLNASFETIRNANSDSLQDDPI